MTPSLPRLALVLAGAIIVAALPAESAAAEPEETAPAPRVVHAPRPVSLGVVDPATLAPLVEEPASAAGEARVLVGNVFPDPAEIPGGEGPDRIDWPRGNGSVTLVTGGDARSLEDATAAFPAIDTRFDGPYQGGIAPPDPVMAAGKNDVVVLINQRIAMYDRQGTLLQGPFSLAGFFGIPGGFSNFDPLALYDPWSDRFIVVATADNDFNQDSRLYIAFSQTNEAAGAWNKYWIDADRDQAGTWADYPSIGVDRFAVYLTANIISRSGGFSNVTLFVYDKEDGYAGTALDNTHLIDVRTAGGASPFRLRPAWINEVVPGDEYFLMYANNAFGTAAEVITLTGDRFASPTTSGTSIPLPSLYFPPGAGRQPGAAGVSTLGASLWNVYYRGGKLWTAQAISGSQGNAAWVHRIDVSAAPYTREETYELEVTGRDTYFPHVVPDVEDNDFALVTAYSGNDLYVTGRYWNVGADGTVRAAELLTDGVRDNNSERHGDYFAAGEDPTDPNRIWMLAQYMSNSTFSGNTKVASVRFEDVAPPTSPPPAPGQQGGDTPLLVEKAAGSDVTLTWDAVSCTPAGHHLVWYDLASMSGYGVADEDCAVGVSGTWTGPPPGGSVGVIVVTDDDLETEGSHGLDSGGAERPSASALCGFTAKATNGTCTP